jgi:endonuclease-8
LAEGPLVHYWARRLHRTLAGSEVTVAFGIERLRDAGESFDGAAVDRVDAHGKQFHIHFEDGRVILVHLLMWGSWRIYRRGAQWNKSRDKMRLCIRTDTHEAVAFSAPVVQVLQSSELADHPRWGGLGPDPLRGDFDEEELFRRLDADPSREIGEVIMDQRVIAGVGNMLRNEILFGAGVAPERTVGSLTGEERQRILGWTRDLMNRWLGEIGRRKKGWLRIYRRSGKPCPECGAPIQFARQARRITYWCPRCQT